VSDAAVAEATRYDAPLESSKNRDREERERERRRRDDDTDDP
jgi:hypothetical protein